MSLYLANVADPELDRISAMTSSIDGWLSDDQGRALFSAAAAASGREAIVEIGSWKGRSTVWLAKGARRAGGRVIAIDPHIGAYEDPTARTLDIFRQNLQRAGVAADVEIMAMRSEEAARVFTGPVEVLFIDGDHTSEGVRRDAELWLPRLVDGGVVMMHDVGNAGYEGPRRIFREMICASPSFESIRRIGSMGVARKTARRGAAAAAWARVASALLYLYDLKRWAKQVRM
jgi:predicted O-methyltransferase YrrM